MAYYIDLFSPETYESFAKSDRSISGFRTRQLNIANRIKIGDKLVCYLTVLGRWVGLLQVESACFEDTTPIFLPQDDPFIVRFKVKPLVWLQQECGLPIRDVSIWNSLSFTKGLDSKSSQWTGKIRSSLTMLDEKDGQFLENLIYNQGDIKKIYKISEQDRKKIITHSVKRKDKLVSVSIPEDQPAEEHHVVEIVHGEVRESIKMQALLAEIGAQMGMKIWIPRNDKAAVLQEWRSENKSVLEILPLNYDEVTLKTIEQIDVLWLKGRSIIRAFEVEHTTSIYSGILRMADLLALQPNMDIKLHLVAPEVRREKVFQELRRPVFSLLDSGPLSESCSYLAYESVIELSKEKLLSHMSDSVLDEFAEHAE